MYQIYKSKTELFAKITELLNQSEGEITEEIALLMEKAAENREELLETIAITYKNMAAVEDRLSAEIWSLTQRKKSIIRSMDKLHLLACREMDPGSKWTNDVHTIASRKNIVVSDDIDMSVLPEKYVRVKTTREPDKIAIKEALTSGEEISIPGAKLLHRYTVTIK